MTALLPYTWHKISWDTPPWPLTPIFEQMCRSIGLILRKPGHRGNRFSKPDSGDAVGNEIQQFSLTRYNTQKNWSGRRDSNSRPQPWQGCALPLSYARVSGPSISREQAASRLRGSQLNSRHRKDYQRIRTAGRSPPETMTAISPMKSIPLGRKTMRPV